MVATVKVDPALSRFDGLNVNVASAGVPGAVNVSGTGVEPAPQIIVAAKVPDAPGSTFRAVGVTDILTFNTVMGHVVVFTSVAEVSLIVTV